MASHMLMKYHNGILCQFTDMLANRFEDALCRRTPLYHDLLFLHNLEFILLILRLTCLRLEALLSKIFLFIWSVTNQFCGFHIIIWCIKMGRLISYLLAYHPDTPQLYLSRKANSLSTIAYQYSAHLPSGIFAISHSIIAWRFSKMRLLFLRAW